MCNSVTIENEHIKAVISTKGAEPVSLKKDGVEQLWCGDPSVWGAQAPILFPICGGLKDEKFLFGGKEYFLEKHGFANKSIFSIENADADRAVFLLKADENSKKKYPFDFEFRAEYSLLENGINVEYSVTNTGAYDMYFSVGAHEGYACPEGIEEYSIVFDKTEDLLSNIVENGLLSHKTICIDKNTNRLPLKKEYFAEDALVFCGLKSRRLWLEKNSGERRIEVSFDGSDYLLLWTIPGANFICIEPWSGLPDFDDSLLDICNKPGIIRLEAGRTEKRSHSVIL